MWYGALTMNQNDIEALRASLKDRGKLTYDEIAFGSGLKTSWVQKFTLGTIKEPRLRNFHALKAFMEKRRAA